MRSDSSSPPSLSSSFSLAFDGIPGGMEATKEDAHMKEATRSLKLDQNQPLLKHSSSLNDLRESSRRRAGSRRRNHKTTNDDDGGGGEGVDDLLLEKRTLLRRKLKNQPPEQSLATNSQVGEIAINKKLSSSFSKIIGKSPVAGRTKMMTLMKKQTSLKDLFVNSQKKHGELLGDDYDEDKDDDESLILDFGNDKETELTNEMSEEEEEEEDIDAIPKQFTIENNEILPARSQDQSSFESIVMNSQIHKTATDDDSVKHQDEPSLNNPAGASKAIELSQESTSLSFGPDDESLDATTNKDGVQLKEVTRLLKVSQYQLEKLSSSCSDIRESSRRAGLRRRNNKTDDGDEGDDLILKKRTLLRRKLKHQPVGETSTDNGSVKNQDSQPTSRSIAVNTGFMESTKEDIRVKESKMPLELGQNQLLRHSSSLNDLRKSSRRAGSRRDIFKNDVGGGEVDDLLEKRTLLRRKLKNQPPEQSLSMNSGETAAAEKLSSSLSKQIGKSPVAGRKIMTTMMKKQTSLKDVFVSSQQQPAELLVDDEEGQSLTFANSQVGQTAAVDGSVIKQDERRLNNPVASQAIELSQPTSPSNRNIKKISLALSNLIGKSPGVGRKMITMMKTKQAYLKDLLVTSQKEHHGELLVDKDDEDDDQSLTLDFGNEEISEEVEEEEEEEEDLGGIPKQIITGNHDSFEAGTERRKQRRQFRATTKINKRPAHHKPYNARLNRSLGSSLNRSMGSSNGSIESLNSRTNGSDLPAESMENATLESSSSTKMTKDDVATKAALTMLNSEGPFLSRRRGKNQRDTLSNSLHSTSSTTRRNRNRSTGSLKHSTGTLRSTGPNCSDMLVETTRNATWESSSSTTMTKNDVATKAALTMLNSEGPFLNRRRGKNQGDTLSSSLHNTSSTTRRNRNRSTGSLKHSTGTLRSTGPNCSDLLVESTRNATWESVSSTTMTKNDVATKAALRLLNSEAPSGRRNRGKNHGDPLSSSLHNTSSTTRRNRNGSMGSLKHSTGTLRSTGPNCSDMLVETTRNATWESSSSTTMTKNDVATKAALSMLNSEAPSGRRSRGKNHGDPLSSSLHNTSSTTRMGSLKHSTGTLRSTGPNCSGLLVESMKNATWESVSSSTPKSQNDTVAANAAALSMLRTTSESSFSNDKISAIRRRRDQNYEDFLNRSQRRIKAWEETGKA